jgi:peptidoglycan-associated lipoprotein
MRTLAEPVHFDFDRSDLGESTRQMLDAKVRILGATPTIHIRIEGHTDDRGSGEYNISLGHRRAAAVRRYLVQRDVDTSRIEIVTYGEERPVCTQRDEACWYRNRRAEVTVVRP